MAIELWHGGGRWSGKPEVRAPREGRYECGPGIYLTSSYERARSYAKGSNVTTLVTLRENIGWLERTERPLETLKDYVRHTPRFRKRDVMLDELSRSAEKHGSDMLPVGHFLNLCIYRRVLSGSQGQALASWFVEQGIDASLHVSSGREHWVIVFNPAAIARYEVVSASKVSLDRYHLPLVSLPAVQKKTDLMERVQ
jgi:hypothetical protein